ncbi:PEP-CTERM sorting domain-containing protein [Sphaerotilus sp.]|uniref:PEP-CTERM sorting domain-containing protein n=1 Tax=Sphaerotilus sp. TaxID=2093942 RepID=UPI002ACEC29D|nr:PEP-CTERM sorting domain-containing protein [Sphaerotilus sp.]MDZ7858887.1 PEP-CTERM sorting domain-containing protein [Sphaerotilus sp.]
MTIRFNATQRLLSALLLVSATQAHAVYAEQEPVSGVSNDAPSIAENLGTLQDDGFLFLSGERQSSSSGGSSADFFRFDVGADQQVSFTIETPTASAMPVIGVFDDGAPNLLLASAFDDNSSTSQFLSFSYQLAPGTYYAAVSGFRLGWQDFDGGGNSGWTYNLLLNSVAVAPAAPVPEPGTMAMLLAGLGVLGMVARRRRS